MSESKHKPNKVWVDKGSEFENRSMKSVLQNSDIEMYSIHNEGKSAVVKRFMTTLKNIIYKHRTSVSKKFDTDKLDDIVNEDNNTYHSTIKT